MPPKGKKGKKGKKLPVLIDGVDTSAMTRDQLEAFALRLKAEMDREREERNYFQLERDKIRTFWEITRQQLEESKLELRKKDKEIEATRDFSDIESKHIVQQMKHLQFENQNKVSEIRAEAMSQVKVAEEGHLLQEMELLSDKRELRKQVREQQEIAQMQLHAVETKYNDKMLQQLEMFEKERKDNDLLHDERMHDQKVRLALFYRTQMFEVEERKNTQIKLLQEHHDLAFNDMKNYYNDITLNNLALIGSLKEQLEFLRKQTERSDRVANEMVNENKRLKEPLDQANIQLHENRRKLEFYERDKQQLSRLRLRNNFLEKRLKSLTWEGEALKLRNDSLVDERERLKHQFGEVITELQQKTGLKNVLLERKVEALIKEDEKRQLVLAKTLATCAPKIASQLENVDQHIESVIDERDKIIQELRYELVRVRKSHDDMLQTFECKLAKYGIPPDELGFKPIRSSTDRDLYLCGPAGLVAHNK